MTDWDTAKCRDEDPELFFPLGIHKAARDQAKDAAAICHTCQLIQPCREGAEQRRERAGVFGGKDFDEDRARTSRREILKTWQQTRTVDARRAAVTVLSAEKMTRDDIAEALGVGGRTVSADRVALGLERRAGGRPRTETVARVRALARQGLTDRQIGDQTGQTRDAVMRMRKHHGIPAGITYAQQAARA